MTDTPGPLTVQRRAALTVVAGSLRQVARAIREHPEPLTSEEIAAWLDRTAADLDRTATRSPGGWITPADLAPACTLCRRVGPHAPDCLTRLFDQEGGR